MSNQATIVVTSISRPNKVLCAIADGAQNHDMRFIVIGDKKSPAEFNLAGCTFYSVADQLSTGFSYAQTCPMNHYARKNIGYLLAIEQGAPIILETDDDNIPYPSFFSIPSPTVSAPTISGSGWENVYAHFSTEHIWPRGLPLEHVRSTRASKSPAVPQTSFCPIQQGLADDNPDVDAIYRLVLPLPIRFEKNRTIVLRDNSWCPFNSQNTCWFPDAYPLLYLPAYCSFRMTDIWRSFVAQRICFENNWGICFFSPTVRQERNEHRLLRDFEEEIPGYLNNERIRSILESIPLRSGTQHLANNLLACYERLVAEKLLGEQELLLLNSWLTDIDRICSKHPRKSPTATPVELLS